MKKRRKKKKNKKNKFDFTKKLVDAITTISGSIKPNFGVGITGKDLKMTSSSEKININENQENMSEVNRGITTVRDENTGYVKVKALPYYQNPMLDRTVIRKEYFENGTQRTFKK